MAPCFSCTLPAWCWCTGSCGWQTGWGLQTFCSCSDRGPWGDGLNVWIESPKSPQPARPVFLPVKHRSTEEGSEDKLQEVLADLKSRLLGAYYQLIIRWQIYCSVIWKYKDLPDGEQILPANMTLVKPKNPSGIGSADFNRAWKYKNFEYAKLIHNNQYGCNKLVFSFSIHRLICKNSEK